MVDLRANPFYLDEESVRWVEETVEGMTLHEKICQLFVDPLVGMKEPELLDFLARYPIAGASFRAAQFTNEEARRIMGHLQEQSRVPLLYAGNCESGPNGALRGGTLVAAGAEVRAARDEQAAYEVGRISGRETAAVGFNWTFGPVGDVLLNWRNTLINTRAYGPDAEFVSRCVEAYNRGCLEYGVMPCLKHFPGDGWEERDQHLVIGNNGLSCEEWDRTFGLIYRNAIQNGVLSIMVAHFTQPAWQRKLNPSLQDADMLPACLSFELVEGLLRGELGYNGLVVTDQTKMMGYYGMKRTEALPRTIAVGCDIILGINDMEEDYEAVKAGIESGTITPQRLQDALYRILGAKAAMGLHRKRQQGTLLPDPAELPCIGCEEHRAIARDIADRAITLVKNVRNELPIRPETHPNIGLILLEGERKNNLMGQGVAANASSETRKQIIAALTEAGFTVKEIPSSMNKGKTKEFAAEYDAVLIFSAVTSFAQTSTVHLRWPEPMSRWYPWYVPELPVAFISLNYTNQLYEVPRVPIFINAYNAEPDTIRLVIRKLMGESPFLGQADEQVWCDCWDTHF